MRKWLDRVAAITVKEFKELFRSRLLVFLSLASPLMMFILFSYGFSLDVNDIPFSFLDYNHSPQSQRLMESFSNNEFFTLKWERFSREEILEDMKLDRVRFAIIIPADFSRKISKGESPKVQILVNGTMANRANVTRGYVEGLIAWKNMKILEEHIQKYSASGSAISLPIDVLPVARFNPSLESKNVLVPGIAGLVLLIYPAILAAISLSRERESGMILNFYTSPVSRIQYILGKAMPLMLTGFLNYLLFFALTLSLFQVPFAGNFFFLSFVTIIYLFSAISIGFLVAALVRSEVAALLITTVLTFLPGFLYSGLMMPVEGMGLEGKMTAQMLPISYFVKIVKGLFLKNINIQGMYFELLGLTSICLVIFGLLILLLKKKL